MLEIKNLIKSFKVSDIRSSLVLNDINFTFPNKGLYFILGKSGSGKSTLINILSGIMNADSGEVLFDNKNVLKFNKKQLNNYLRNDISILFQKYNLLNDMTVMENLMIAKDIKGYKNIDVIDDLLKKYNLDDKKNQIVSSLSGGEKQRLALIRSLVSQPKILFCDEPTGALDEENSFKLIELLNDISKDILVIVVTHNLNLFELKHDGFIKLVNGKIAEKDGEKQDLITLEDKKYSKCGLRFIPLVSKKNIDKNIFRNLISTISCAISIIVTLLSIFFKNGILENRKFLIDSYVNKNAFSISLNKTEEIENSIISLAKSERPTYEQVYTLVGDRDFIIHYSYDYFLQDKKTINFDTIKVEEFTIRPFYNPKLAMNEIIVNEEFANLIGNDIVGKEVSLSLKTSFSYISEKNNLTITETFEKEIPFSINSVQKEFSYMNQPTIYYSTFYFEKILSETLALNSSLDRDQNISFMDLLKESKPNSELSGYAMNIFCYTQNDRNIMHNIINDKDKNNFFTVENFGYSMVQSFVSMSNSIFLGMNIFIGICIITSLFITGFLAYSSALQNRKESAIISSLGASDDAVLSVYLLEQMFFVLSGVFFGVLLSYLIRNTLNIYFEDFLVTKNLILFDWDVVLTTSLLGIAICFLTNVMTLKAIKFRRISEELKEE